jgi:hypothetical protein
MTKKLFGNLTAIVLFTSLLSACSSAPVKSARPDWIDNPGDGVSASAATNVYGRVKQEETAILRARTELAKRKGVSIAAVQSTSTTVANNRATSSGQGASFEETNQSNVQGMVKAKWHDEEKDTLWVWLVPSK